MFCQHQRQTHFHTSQTPLGELRSVSKLFRWSGVLKWAQGWRSHTGGGSQRRRWADSCKTPFAMHAWDGALKLRESEAAHVCEFPAFYLKTLDTVIHLCCQEAGTGEMLNEEVSFFACTKSWGCHSVSRRSVRQGRWPSLYPLTSFVSLFPSPPEKVNKRTIVFWEKLPE